MATTYTLPAGLSLNQKKAMASLYACSPCCSGSGSGSSGSVSGSGSGSGNNNTGGGLTLCCGCTSFPSTLNFTFVVPCIGTKTGVLTKVTQPSHDCVDTLGDPRVDYYFTESHGTTSTHWDAIDCASGFPVGGNGGQIETWSVGLTCCPTLGATPPIKKWYFRTSAQKIAGGSRYVVTWNHGIDLSSCSPIVFEHISGSAVCSADAHLVPICGEASGFGDYTDNPVTSWTNCLGSAVTLDISE